MGTREIPQAQRRTIRRILRPLENVGNGRKITFTACS